MLKIHAIAAGTTVFLGLAPMIVQSSALSKVDDAVEAEIELVATDTACTDSRALKTRVHFETCRIVVGH